MQRPDGAVYHKVAGRTWPVDTKPEEDTQQRYIYGMSTYGTAQYVGALAMAARVYQPFMPDFAEELDSAKLAQDYLTNNPTPLFEMIRVKEMDPDPMIKILMWRKGYGH